MIQPGASCSNGVAWLNCCFCLSSDFPLMIDESRARNAKMKIAVIGGDGTGPEVVAEGLKVLKAAAAKVGFEYETKDFNASGERYLAAGGNPPWHP